MLFTGCSISAENDYPPHILELQFSMCPLAQAGPPNPIVRWILEEGQLLGVLVASDPLLVAR